MLSPIAEYVLELIDVQEDFPEGIDWQLLADAAMNYDRKISCEEFCEAIAGLTDKYIIEFFLEGWILNHSLLWA